MAYQKSHGLQLALNAVIKNFGVESITTDPTVTEAGRAWFNSTDKRYKMSTLDGGGAVVIRSFATLEELQAHITALASTTADASGSTLVGYDGHAGTNGNLTVASGNLASSLDSIVDAIDAETENRNTAVTSLTLQDIYNQTTPDVSGDAAIHLATGKDFKIEDDDQTTIFFKVDSETGAVTITGDLYVSGTTTTVESSVTDADHWALTPGSGSTTALSIEPDAAVSLTADLVNWKVSNGSNAVFRVTSDGTVIANGRTILTDGTNLDSHLDAAVMSQHDAAQIDYDNSTSGLTSLTVQAAIDELGNTIGGGSGNSLTTQLANLRTFVGADDGSDVDPAYSSTSYVVQGTSLTTAIGGLDSALAGVASDLATEQNTRAAADTALQNELDAAEAAAGLTAAGAYVANTSANYIDSATTLKQADDLLDAQVKSNADAIAAETSARTTADTTMQGELDDTQSGAGLAADGSYQANSSANYISTATSLADADDKLDAQVKVNTDDIAAETSARTSADTTLQNNIDAEATARANADTAINTTIGTLADLDTTDKTDIVSAINEVAADGGTAISDLKTEINDTKFIFNSSSAAVTHTVTHNLGSQNVSVDVWVMGTDNKFHNDLVPVTINDNNVVVVELSEARNVKVIVEKQDALA